jgi:hypothetical protein
VDGLRVSAGSAAGLRLLPSEGAQTSQRRTRELRAVAGGFPRPPTTSACAVFSLSCVAVRISVFRWAPWNVQHQTRQGKRLLPAAARPRVGVSAGGVVSFGRLSVAVADL